MAYKERERRKERLAEMWIEGRKYCLLSNSSSLPRKAKRGGNIRIMSSALSDAEDQPSSTSACFRFIPSKIDHDPAQHHPNPDSSFYVIKTGQQSSSPFHSSAHAAARPGNARTLFTVIPPMPQDTATHTRVRYQLVLFCAHAGCQGKETGRRCIRVSIIAKFILLRPNGIESQRCPSSARTQIDRNSAYEPIFPIRTLRWASRCRS